MREYFAVAGGVPLEGCVTVQGAKNSALPLLAATLLARGESILHNCPDLSDISVALEILTCLGCRVRRRGATVLVDTSACCGTEIPDGLMSRMRASVLFLGALLAREGSASACWPGGCALGSRPIDLHLEAFRALGAGVRVWNGRLSVSAPCLTGRKICFPFPSVGATENAMLAACGASGVTVLCNAAREPELEDLQAFLCSLGADVTGAGTQEIVIRGGRALHPGEHTVMFDRIAAATYLCALAAAGGRGEVRGAEGRYLTAVLEALSATGCTWGALPDGLWLCRTENLEGIGPLATGPYPAFPTDAQPLLTAALAGGEGKSRITERIFDRRFRYIEGLVRMGADIQIQGDTAWVIGRPLHGAWTEAPDLRGGAALTLAALAARGESRIYGLDYMDRGYEDLETALTCLGAKIRRVREET